MGRGVARRDPSMFLPKSSCVYTPHIKSVTPRVCLAKVPFLASFGPDRKKEMGVVISMHLIHSPDYIISTFKSLTP